jgi:hypothetical protein
MVEMQGCACKRRHWSDHTAVRAPMCARTLLADAGEVLAAGDPAVHAEAVRLLAWEEHT